MSILNGNIRCSKISGDELEIKLTRNIVGLNWYRSRRFWWVMGMSKRALKGVMWNEATGDKRTSAHRLLIKESRSLTAISSGKVYRGCHIGWIASGVRVRDTQGHLCRSKGTALIITIRYCRVQSQNSTFVRDGTMRTTKRTAQDGRRANVTEESLRRSMPVSIMYRPVKSGLETKKARQ